MLNSYRGYKQELVSQREFKKKKGQGSECHTVDGRQLWSANRLEVMYLAHKLIKRGFQVGLAKASEHRPFTIYAFILECHKILAQL